MSETTRPERMNLRLSTTEKHLRDALADHFGIDAAGVMRMGLLELARKAGISSDALPKKKSAGKR